MKIGILVFPGSNCDQDCYHVAKSVLNAKADYIWHKDTSVDGFDALIIPGGFSYGDYLRCGAIARFSPVMKAVVQFAEKGGPVLGICNGFQILVESGLLPGVLMRNRGLKFICDGVTLKLKSNRSSFTKSGKENALYQMPIAHMEGNYFIDKEGYRALVDQDQIVFQYTTAQGQITDEANPNGAMANIAGICNKKGNVLGMMPHPERVSENVLGATDGYFIFESLMS